MRKRGQLERALDGREAEREASLLETKPDGAGFVFRDADLLVDLCDSRSHVISGMLLSLARRRPGTALTLLMANSSDKLTFLEREYIQTRMTLRVIGG